MTLDQLITELVAIRKVHPELADAQVRAADSDGNTSFLAYVRFTKETKFKPAIVWLEE